MIVPQTVVCLKILNGSDPFFGDNGILNVPLDYSPVDKYCQALFYDENVDTKIRLKIRFF